MVAVRDQREKDLWGRRQGADTATIMGLGKGKPYFFFFVDDGFVENSCVLRHRGRNGAFVLVHAKCRPFRDALANNDDMT